MGYRGILLSAAIAAAAVLTAAGPASAVTCIPPGGVSSDFNPINPAFAAQGISNCGPNRGRRLLLLRSLWTSTMVRRWPSSQATLQT